MNGITQALPAVFVSALFVYTAMQLIKACFGFLNYARAEARVQQRIEEALEMASGERVTVMKFHTPGETTGLIPYSFMSCEYEAFAEGNGPVSHILRQIPTALLTGFLQRLCEGPVMLDTGSPDFSVTRVGYELIAVQGETKALCFMLRDSCGGPAGYVSLKKRGGFTDGDAAIMAALARDLGRLLENWGGKGRMHVNFTGGV